MPNRLVGRIHSGAVQPKQRWRLRSVPVPSFKLDDLADGRREPRSCKQCARCEGRSRSSGGAILPSFLRLSLTAHSPSTAPFERTWPTAASSKHQLQLQQLPYGQRLPSEHPARLKLGAAPHPLPSSSTAFRHARSISWLSAASQKTYNHSLSPCRSSPRLPALLVDPASTAPAASSPARYCGLSAD